MDWYYRILECAACGVAVADFGKWRVNWSSGEAHVCRPKADALDDLTAQALAGGTDLDKWVVEAVEVMLTTPKGGAR